MSVSAVPEWRWCSRPAGGVVIESCGGLTKALMHPGRDRSCQLCDDGIDPVDPGRGVLEHLQLAALDVDLEQSDPVHVVLLHKSTHRDAAHLSQTPTGPLSGLTDPQRPRALVHVDQSRQAPAAAMSAASTTTDVVEMGDIAPQDGEVLRSGFDGHDRGHRVSLGEPSFA